MARRDKNIAADFFKMYHRLCSPIRTNRETYFIAEKVWVKRNGGRCFKNYGSFRKSKEYHLSKHRK